jgi:hypothetical protein
MKMTKEQQRAFDRMAKEVGKFLQTIGWKALVIGIPRVQQQPGELKYNFEFVMRFTGKQIERPQPAGRKNATPLVRKT